MTHHHHVDDGWDQARAAVFHDDEAEAHDHDHERFGLDPEPCRRPGCTYRRHDD